jgi:hypothetical protein
MRRDVGLISFRPGVKVTAATVGGTGHRPNVGEVVFSIGCNHGADPTIADNKIIAVNRYHGPPNLVVGGRPVDGRSGGGLFTKDGLLIGVCNAADSEYDEGLYAALGNVHSELDGVGLSYIYRKQHAAIAGRTPPPLATDHPHQPRTQPKSVLVLDRPSKSLLNQLAAEANRRGPHQATLMHVDNTARKGAAQKPIAAQTQSATSHGRPPSKSAAPTGNDGDWRSLVPTRS